MKIAIGALMVISLCLVVITAILIEAHLEMGGITPALPAVESFTSLGDVDDGPIRIRYVNTATQRGPGHVMGHPAFLLEWSDGRSFLIDSGMEPEEAAEFGEPFELLMDAEPTEVHGSVSDQLGEAIEKIEGAAFTHLHMDHTQGFAELCEDPDVKITLFQTRLQAERDNFGTTSGHEDIRLADCAKRVVISGAREHEVPGFPGLLALPAGGHTPGSTIYVARVGDTTWVLSGDITNFKASIDENRPKPLIYGLLIVPENSDHLETLRLWLDELDDQPGTVVVPSHDLTALEKTGMQPYPRLNF